MRGCGRGEISAWGALKKIAEHEDELVFVSQKSDCPKICLVIHRSKMAAIFFKDVALLSGKIEFVAEACVLDFELVGVDTAFEWVVINAFPIAQTSHRVAPSSWGGRLGRRTCCYGLALLGVFLENIFKRLGGFYRWWAGVSSPLG